MNLTTFPMRATSKMQTKRARKGNPMWPVSVRLIVLQSAVMEDPVPPAEKLNGVTASRTRDILCSRVIVPVVAQFGQAILVKAPWCV